MRRDPVAEPYTPTTEEVHGRYQASVDEYGTISGRALSYDEAGAAFTRWLAEHDRQVRTEALREAADDFVFGTRQAPTTAHWLNDRADRIAAGEDA